MNNPQPGDLYQHTESGTIAAFREFRKNKLTDQWLLVLDHPTFGECRWASFRARPYKAGEKR